YCFSLMLHYFSPMLHYFSPIHAISRYFSLFLANRFSKQMQPCHKSKIQGFPWDGLGHLGTAQSFFTISRFQRFSFSGFQLFPEVRPVGWLGTTLMGRSKSSMFPGLGTAVRPLYPPPARKQLPPLAVA